MVTTLVVVYDDQKILLGLKKRGFGSGRWNGFGGKVSDQESLEAAAARELEEEAGIVAEELIPRGELVFTFQNEVEDIEVKLFELKSYQGEPVETEEMRPQWFSHNEIPYDEMWADDRLWLPLFLSGKKIRGTVYFDEPGTQVILSHTIEGYD